MKIAIACDHAGLEMKREIVELLKNPGIEIFDFGTYSEESVDYPDHGAEVASRVSNQEVDRGILICGTGLGMSIVANKYNGVRATLCHDAYTAEMSRLHNDSNVLVIGGRTTAKEIVKDMVRTWLSTSFEGGRHNKRLGKISQIEKELSKKID